MASGRCRTCGYWKELDRHHFVHVGQLTPAERRGDKFVIRLCNDCHIGELHSRGEYAFYKRHRLIDECTRQCGSDTRWMKWLSGQQWRHEVK